MICIRKRMHITTRCFSNSLRKCDLFLKIHDSSPPCKNHRYYWLRLGVYIPLSGGSKPAKDGGFGEHWQQSYRIADRLLVLLPSPNEPVTPPVLTGVGMYTKSERADSGPAAEDSDTTCRSAEQSVVSLECLHDTSRRSRSHGSTYFRCWNHIEAQRTYAPENVTIAIVIIILCILEYIKRHVNNNNIIPKKFNAIFQYPISSRQNIILVKT